MTFLPDSWDGGYDCNRYKEQFDFSGNASGVVWPTLALLLSVSTTDYINRCVTRTDVLRMSPLVSVRGIRGIPA